MSISSACSGVCSAIRSEDGGNALRFEKSAAQDWVQASLAGLAPVAAGRFVVHGAHDRARVQPNQIGIEIEAALAFGTGHHGTTRGCLLALDRSSQTRPQSTMKSGTPSPLTSATVNVTPAVTSAHTSQISTFGGHVGPR